MEASLRNEPIKMKYKLWQRKIKRHLKVKNTIADIFQVLILVLLTGLCGTKKIFYIRFKNVLKVNLAGENAVTRLHCMEFFCPW